MRWNLREAESPSFGDNLTVKILRDVEKFLMTSNTPPTRFGREAMGDPRFVFDLRRGGSQASES